MTVQMHVEAPSGRCAEDGEEWPCTWAAASLAEKFVIRDMQVFDERIDANERMPSLAGYQALVADLRAALRAKTGA
jgi:hypothetical protein